MGEPALKLENYLLSPAAAVGVAETRERPTFQIIGGGLAEPDATERAEQQAQRETLRAACHIEATNAYAEQVAADVVASLKSFIPKMGNRVYRTRSKELHDWNRLPPWQKIGLQLQDPSFLALPEPIRRAVTAQVRKVGAAALFTD